MLRSIAIRGMPLVLAVSAAPVLAAADATISQVYEAARSGHIDQAEQMISQVLRDYPGSAKAHYVAAEVYAHAGDYPTARRELSAAERLSPGLPFVRAEAVATLQRQLTRSVAPLALGAAPRATSVPWGLILLIVGGIAVAWAIVRRRQAYAYSQYPASLPPATGLPGGVALGGGPVLGGGGPGLMGSLATGLAVGAGVAAGEELVRHVIGGEHGGGGVIPAADAGEWRDNQDLGGDNFGITGGGGWDDGGSSSFGGDVGGGDWT